MHWDGWDKARYKRTLPRLGYGSLSFAQEAWQGTHNVTVTAAAEGSPPPRERLLEEAEDLLRASMVDDSESERRQLAHWVEALRS